MSPTAQLKLARSCAAQARPNRCPTVAGRSNCQSNWLNASAKLKDVQTIRMANLLQTVARLYNIQAKYRDGFGQMRAAPPEAILSVLRSLGAPVRAHDDLPDALRERRQAQWQRCIEPITVAWQDRPFKIKLRLPRALGPESN